MPAYPYRCTRCQRETEADYPMGENPRVIRCQCGQPARQILGAGLHLSAAATPTSKSDVLGAVRRDHQFELNAPAYRRMRQRGLQPSRILDSARLENEVGSQVEIDYSRAIQTASDAERYKAMTKNVDNAAPAGGGLERVKEAIAESTKVGISRADAEKARM